MSMGPLRIRDGSNAEILLQPNVKEHFNIESWNLVPGFWLICGFALIIHTLPLENHSLSTHVETEHQFVMIFLSSNNLLTYLELQNLKTADCEVIGE